MQYVVYIAVEQYFYRLVGAVLIHSHLEVLEHEWPISSLAVASKYDLHLNITNHSKKVI